MKVYANRYGMIESTELAFALCAEQERMRGVEDARRHRDARRAAWREGRQRGLGAAARLLGRVRPRVLPARLERA